MTFFRRLAAFAVLCLAPLVCSSQTLCQIKVFQDQVEITSTGFGTILSFILKPAEFQIEVSPASCSPTIATIPNAEIAKQIAEKPIIYAARWTYVMAAYPEDSDKLLWWTRAAFEPELREPPNPNSFDGTQYQNLCEELKFCPNVYPIFSSGRPFTDTVTGSKSVANFKRLDAKSTFEDAKGKRILSVIYTLWRSLPSEYPMADPRALLFLPNFIYFTFSKQ